MAENGFPHATPNHVAQPPPAEADDGSEEEDAVPEMPRKFESDSVGGGLANLRRSVEALNMLYALDPLRDQLDSTELTPRDVIIAGFHKSGTNWLQQIVHQIKMKGTDEDFDELTDEVPFLSLISLPLGYDLDSEQKGDFKVFKTHDVMEDLPSESINCRIIVLFRNPADILSAYYSWEPKFGCYDPLGEVGFHDFYENKFNNTHERMPITYFDFVVSWIELSRDNSNILILFYENLVQNIDREMNKILQFLDVNSLSKSEIDRIKYVSSFEYMKKNESKFDLHGMHQRISEFADDQGEQFEKIKNPSFLNRGGKRDGKREVPPDILHDMDTCWKAVVEQRLGYTSYDDLRDKLK